MAKRKFKINLFDVLAIVAVVAIGLMVIFANSNKPSLGAMTVQVEVKVSDKPAIDNILPSLQMTEEGVYYNGTKYPIRQTGYRVENDPTGAIKYLYITLEGPGEIAGGNSIFNGQRIYVNQKAEIHADYRVKGYVSDFHYAD
ncbi:MAG: hypothetical protein WCI79_00510 [Candidatus Saccharibacteria bacterium]